MKSRDELHDYWRNPPEQNNPKRYARKLSSPFLVGVFEKHVNKELSILELGCNIGRNLNALYQAGYMYLHGVDINPHALYLMREKYPEMSNIANVKLSALEYYWFQKCDVIFTMAVLCHIHPDSEFIFEYMSENANMIITFEDEHGKGTRHFARNYEEVFSPLDFEQVAYYHEIEGMNKNYHCRVMVKR
jgi:SAM-dependent methyltransferase